MFSSAAINMVNREKLVDALRATIALATVSRNDFIPQGGPPALVVFPLPPVPFFSVLLTVNKSKFGIGLLPAFSVKVWILSTGATAVFREFLLMG
jgi:hypothetical protein